MWVAAASREEEEMNSQDVEKTMSADYFNLFVNGRAFSDVTFSVEGREIHAHRCILAARSSFFRMIFCSQPDRIDAAGGQVIPVGAVGYDVFIIVLQFLYSGQLIIAPNQAIIRYKCKERACWHQYCSSAVELALDTLSAALFFGIDQLSILVQKQLGGMIEKASIDDLMRVVVAAKKQELPHLSVKCFDLVVKSGLTPAALKKHLPIELVQEIEMMRNKEGGYCGISRREHVTSAPTLVIEEQRIRRMQQALDSLDVELVRLMVMGEGLNLDKAHALHYGVTNCSRDIVKALLELGAVDVNYPCKGGFTALHLAAQLVNPDMISVLLDHHADPYLRSHQGATPLDIIRSLSLSTSTNSSSCSSSSPCTGALRKAPKFDQNKLHLCLELLQSAVFVASKDESTESNLSTTGQSGGSVDGSSFAAVDQDLASVYPEFRFPPCLAAFGSSENPLNPIL